ncbi:hypothetical protein BCR34DRAFT_607204 [Clohesyomyces aquaticus]|uniref:BTB domain-containing protein n=1 Tax=Clohesyomyces aquaticus TaxID=1231657 RepID=A0A1Y1YHT6_9PLEO|nr:hypothetical protein BCR34DRAFT_607204 [Clohesyomyces aquaticus]
MNSKLTSTVRSSRRALANKMTSNFTITCGGVEWETRNRKPPRKVELGRHLHPVFAARLVQLIYTGTHSLDRGGKCLKFHHATKITDNLSRFPLPNLNSIACHTRMYQVGEYLKYEALQEGVQGRLAVLCQCRVWKPKDLKDLIKVLYLDSQHEDTQIFGDEEGWLRSLACCAVLLYEDQCGDNAEKLEFKKRVIEGILQFQADCYKIKSNHKDLINHSLDIAAAGKRQMISG